MAVSEDRKFTKEQVKKTANRNVILRLMVFLRKLRPPEFVYPKENRNHPFSHLSQLLLGKNHVDDGLDHLLLLREDSVSSAASPSIRVLEVLSRKQVL